MGASQILVGRESNVRMGASQIVEWTRLTTTSVGRINFTPFLAAFSIRALAVSMNSCHWEDVLRGCGWMFHERVH